MFFSLRVSASYPVQRYDQTSCVDQSRSQAGINFPCVAHCTVGELLTWLPPERKAQPEIPEWVDQEAAEQDRDEDERVRWAEENEATNVKDEQEHCQQVAPIVKSAWEVSAASDEP